MSRWAQRAFTFRSPGASRSQKTPSATASPAGTSGATRSVKRAAQASLRTYDGANRDHTLAVAESGGDVAAVIAELEEEMQEAANKLEFERAALIRDQVNALKTGTALKAGASRGYARGGRKRRA